VAGHIFDRIGSFLSNFFVAGVILLPGILAYLLLLGKIEQMPSPGGDYRRANSHG
jgi:ACS family D-galactonate transporter-like MFS transporter